MNQSNSPRAHASLSAHTLGRVAVTALALTLALPAVVFLAANPGLAVAFAAGLLTARARPAVAAAFAWVSRLPARVAYRQPASE